MKFVLQKSAGLTLEQALASEWLETNDLGGYASSSIINCNTRKYHGLLVVKLPELPNKYVLLNTLEDSVVLDGQEHFLTAHQYPGMLQDGSFSNFQEFTLDTHPVFTFKFATFSLVKEILLLHQENVVLIKYKLIADPQVTVKLRIKPLLAWRDFHALTGERPRLKITLTSCSAGVKLASQDCLPPVFVQALAPHCTITREPLWYRNFIYLQEKLRGYADREDLLAPVNLELVLTSAQEVIVAGALQEQSDLATRWQNEIMRRTNQQSLLRGSEVQRQLKKVGQSFLTHINRDVAAVTAGYHWFLEWGRDAMLALPGLTLYSGLEKTCLQVLRTFAAQEQDGLIPNFLGATLRENAYNSVDASLWFAWAVQQYYLKTQDLKGIVQECWPALKKIFYAYQQGTKYQIKMQESGLIYAGNAQTNLTWMDAAIDGVAVTPRYGLQVEVNALWFNLLGLMRSVAAVLLDPVKVDIERVMMAVKKSFATTFWCEKLGYCYDFVNEQECNSALRPNQIFAVSLPYSAIPKKNALKIVKVVQNHLLTPYGLRTLAVNDPHYQGTYGGDVKTRDRAYHNGTVWPWLLGHFGEAWLRVNDNPKAAAELFKPCLEALTQHLHEAGMGTISEVFNGSSPQQPGGCISQAWSVAEVLRLTYLLNMSGK